MPSFWTRMPLELRMAWAAWHAAQTVLRPFLLSKRGVGGGSGVLVSSQKGCGFSDGLSFSTQMVRTRTLRKTSEWSGDPDSFGILFSYSHIFGIKYHFRDSGFGVISHFQDSITSSGFGIRHLITFLGLIHMFATWDLNHIFGIRDSGPGRLHGLASIPRSSRAVLHFCRVGTRNQQQVLRPLGCRSWRLIAGAVRQLRHQRGPLRRGVVGDLGAAVYEGCV